MRKTAYFVTFALLLCAIAIPSTAMPPPLAGQLVNGSFEAGWHEQGAGELVLPDGWTLEYRDGNHPWCEAPCNRPEVKPNQEFVTDGAYSIRSFTTFSRGLYGIYQAVEAEPGAWYRFECQARIDSNPPGELAAFVGIQPWAGGIFERQMIWGPETQAQLQWVTIGVTAQAYGDKLRVAMGANNKWPTKGNTVWWDNCTLERVEVGGECPACPECPECPTCPPGGEFDWLKMIELVRAVVNDELANREPVRWPPR